MNFCVFYKFARCILVFFDKLQIACDKKGIAMSALLDKIDMSRGNIARWKSGLEPKAATKQKLAEALGIDREELEEREKPAAADELDELVKDELVGFYGDVKKELTPGDIEDIKTLMKLRAELNRSKGK
ncbi:MAG: helix-turn-helix domain-containing protein [Ruthenibacterium lactatiformans]